MMKTTKDIKDVLIKIEQKSNEILGPLNKKMQTLSHSTKIVIIASVAILMLVVFKPFVFRDNGVYNYFFQECYDNEYSFLYPAMGIDNASLKSYCKKISDCIARKVAMEDLAMADMGYQDPDLARAIIRCDKKYKLENEKTRELEERARRMKKTERMAAMFKID